MTTVQAPVAQIISRTIRCNDSATDISFLDDHIKDNNVVVTQSNNDRRFIQCTTTDIAEQVYTTLLTSEKPSYITYSLFFKNVEQLSQDTYTDVFMGNDGIVNSICPGARVTYHRLDNNGFTGKLVVDVLSDYMKFKNYEVENDIKFYHFDSNRNRNRRTRTKSTDSVELKASDQSTNTRTNRNVRNTNNSSSVKRTSKRTNKTTNVSDI